MYISKIIKPLAAAGSLGAYTGIAGTTFQGLLVGGALNTSTYAISKGLIGGQQLDGYKALQKFVGGALSAYGGIAAFGKAKYLKFGKNYIGGNKVASKALLYGIQNSATDFAYTDQKKYMERGLLEHLLIFNTGMLGGTIQYAAGYDDLFKNSRLESEFFKISFRTLIGLSGYGLEYSGNTFFTGNDPFDNKKGWRKVSIGTYKSIFYNLILK